MTRKIKALLIQPNFHKYYIPFLPNYEPLVMIMLASHIEDLAEVKIFDRRFERESALIKILKEFKPDIVATRTHTSGEVFTAKRILEVAKKIVPETTTIVGGQHPSLLPDDLNEAYIDLICIGPGEETFREVAQAKAEGAGFENIKGLAVQRKGELFFTEERHFVSDTFAWPPLNRQLAAKYKKHFPAGFTITSIGCPHRCNFCALWIAARGTYRIREAGNVIEDIESIPQPFVYIGDDNTFHDYSHAISIYEGIKKKRIKKHYGAYARTDTIVQHRELFEMWHEIGLTNLVVGFEVTNEQALKDINKKNTLENNLKAIQILNEIGIQNYAHFIMFPDFRQQDFNDVWKFLKKYKISQPYFIPLTPLAGTPLYKEYKENGRLSTHNYGFYNLEFMVCKTLLPKWHWYFLYLMLWFKTISPLTFLTFRINFPLSAYLYRIKIITRAFFPYTKAVLVQLKEERSLRHHGSNKLFPSQRDGYHFRYLKDLPPI